jgi:hypothetical protein
MLHHWSPCAPAEKIKGGIVGDTEQPALRIVDDTDTGQSGEGFDHCVLNDILSIDGRAGHASAVSMQLWTKLTHQALKLITQIISH